MHVLRLLLVLLVSATTAADTGDRDFRASLKETVNALASSTRTDDIRAFYAAMDYAPAWFRDDKPTRQAAALVRLLRCAGAKGLRAEDYDAEHLADQLDQLNRLSSTVLAWNVARFDRALTISVMRYVSDLHIGRVNPKQFHAGFDLVHEKYDLPGLVHARLINAIDVEAAVSDIEPPFPGYRRTEETLQRYLAMAGEDQTECLPVADKPIEPGDSYPGAQRLARMLRRLGDLPAEAKVFPDSYQGVLVDAVKRFQSRHGLEPDGQIGPATFRQLNTPLMRRVRQLQLTLERYRWVPHQFNRPPIVVNIPEFRLRAMNDSYRTALEMKVVVGRAYHHKTPVLASDLNFVVFRPYWDVPPGIQRGELLPKIARDPDYLTRNGYEVVSSAEHVVTNRRVDDAVLAQLRSGTLRIRQIPGGQNALGLVKFLFPNEYNVYMHGTPAAELFSKSRRDFSHGCIRLEKPEELAAWALRGKIDWTSDRIAAAMNGTRTIKVTLEKPIPVLIVYATAVVLENGEVHFFEAIYGHDAVLEKILTSGTPAPTPETLAAR
jgi:L,D-transpeptidase YcbB